MKKIALDIPLISLSELSKGIKKVFGVSKEDSDKQIAELQRANARKRQAKKAKP